MFNYDPVGGTSYIGQGWTATTTSTCWDGSYSYRPVYHVEDVMTPDEVRKILDEALEEERKKFMSDRYSLWEVTVVDNETFEIVFDGKLVAKGEDSAKMKAARDLEGEFDDFTIVADLLATLPEKKEPQEVVIISRDET